MHKRTIIPAGPQLHVSMFTSILTFSQPAVISHTGTQQVNRSYERVNWQALKLASLGMCRPGALLTMGTNQDFATQAPSRPASTSRSFP